ncbi:MAG: FG-GAP repeat domain-containing protein, partial [Byssovorax sp.]
MWRFLQSTRAVRLLAAVLVGCFLPAACNGLLPHDFEFTFENGQPCTEGGDCASGLCSADSICCAEVCSGPCQSCMGGASCSPLGVGLAGKCPGSQVCSAAHTCEATNGQLCDVGAEGGDCASGFCSSDSICCAEVCSGPCQSCKGGETCSLVSKDSKGACTGNQVCSAEGVCYCSNQGFLGSPTGRIVYSVGQFPTSVAALDLNGDGKPDLAVANDHVVSVLRNQGDGTFAAPVNYITGAAPFS